MKNEELLTEIRKVLKEEVSSGLVEVHEMIGDLSTMVDVRLTGVETRLTRVEAEMVTKSYLDEKLSTFRGEVIEVSKNAALRAVGAI